MRVIIKCILILLHFTLLSQTRISLPPATINFAELSQVEKPELKKLKKSDRFKDKRVKEVKKQLKKNTSFSNEEIEQYATMVRSLDSTEIVAFQEQLEEVVGEQNGGSEVEKWKNEAGQIKNDSSFFKTKLAAIKDRTSNQLLDSISTIGQENGVSQHHIDSLARLKKYSRVKKDSLVTTGEEDSIAVANDNTNEQLISSDSLSKRDSVHVVNESNEGLGQQMKEHQPYASDLDSISNTLLDSASVANFVKNKAQMGIDTTNLNVMPLMDSLGAAIPLEAFQNDSIAKVALENKVEAFMESFALERASAQGLSLPTELANEAPTVQEFIPSLEQFDYIKPEIPTEKLMDAVVAQEKEKRLDQLKSEVLPSLEKNDSLQKEVKWIKKWQLGGSLSYKPEDKLVELTPTIAYGVIDKVSVGCGYSTVILLDRSVAIEKQTAYRLFVDYTLFRSFFLHGESEWKEQIVPESPPIKERSTLLGLGRTFQYKSISTNVLALYNLNAPNAIDNRRFSFRFALNFNP